MNALPHILATTLAFSAFLGSALAMNSTAVDEILKLKTAGLGDEGIVAFIKNKNVNYDLSSDDLVLLKNQGVSSAVLAAMLSTGNSQTVPAQAPPRNLAVPTLPAPPAPSSAGPVLAVTPAPNLTPAPALPPPPNISPDAAYFYQQLSPFGRWILAEDNQYYWQPSVATGSWQPYADQGHWVFTDSGWYWASDYPWGWAAFHYGRWRLHPLHGWIWWPDRVWAPAWVAWRTGGEYCGWAPLPPGSGFDAAGLLVYHGRLVGPDFDFGLDWHHFNFCLVRDMGEPHFGGLHRDADRRMAFKGTKVVNHYTVSRTVIDGHTEIRMINHGIETARVSAARGRRIETMTIEDLHAPAPNRAHERLDKDHKTLEVYRPHWVDHDGHR